MAGRPKRRERERQRAELYGRLRTLAGAAVACDIVQALADEDPQRAAALTEQQRERGELDHLLAGAMSLLTVLVNRLVEASDDLDHADVLDDLRLHHIAAHQDATSAAWLALDDPTDRQEN